MVTLAACGGSETKAANPSQQVTKSKATVQVKLTGTLPAATAISGVEFTINLPTNITPKNINGIVDSDVVIPSGVFAGSATSTQCIYSATETTLKVIITSSVETGVTAIGEVATITLPLTNNSVPSTSSFSIASSRVFDVATISAISNIGMTVGNVTFE
jgi:hypothetical protein